jgi:hypothetical protein
MSTKFIDLKGQVFGQLTVLYRNTTCKKGNTQWICRCSCGTEESFFRSSLTDRGIISCWECSIAKRPYGHPMSRMLHKVKQHAKTTNRKCTLTKKYLLDLFNKQNRKCALTGLDLQIARRSKEEIETTASLDRIDSSKDYIQGNVQWVHKDINWMKQDYSQDEFIKYCKLVTNYN